MQTMIETHLRASIEPYQQHLIGQAMAYSLLDGGKRIRPRMLLAALADLDGKAEQGIHAACALEMIHTYSLIHDDLPALDNDDYRRHKLANHKQFDEATAILAGDALLTESFNLISCMDTHDFIMVQCLGILSKASGMQGMIVGQEYDLGMNETTFADLETTYRLKTGKLFAAALEMAAVISGNTDKRDAAHELGLLLGVAFQIQDDLLEVTQDFNAIGKSTGSDAERRKPTALSFMSLEESHDYLQSCFRDIEAGLMQITGQKPQLRLLIHEIIGRSF